MSKVSLKALSEYLGLTDGTVSRALNNYPDISLKTRHRVKEAALKLGYRPNSSARRLATGNAECIGYVLPGNQAICQIRSWQNYLTVLPRQLQADIGT